MDSVSAGVGPVADALETHTSAVQSGAQGLEKRVLGGRPRRKKGAHTASPDQLRQTSERCRTSGEFSKERGDR